MQLRIADDPEREAFTKAQAERYNIAFNETLRAYKAFCDTRLYSVIVSHDDIGHDILSGPDLRWHVSAAGESYLPKWADFVAIVQEVRPGVMFCVPMPPRQFWLNVNPYTLHVWELRDEPLERQWRDEGRATRRGQREGRFPGFPEPS